MIPHRRPHHRFLTGALLVGPCGAVLAQIMLHAGAHGAPRPAVTMMALLQLIVLAPLLEELVFRGGVLALFDRVRWGRTEYLPGITTGNVLTSVAFAATHLMISASWLAVATFLPSLIFGRLKQLYEPRLVPAIAMHAWYNLCFLAIAHGWSAAS